MCYDYDFQVYVIIQRHSYFFLLNIAKDWAQYSRQQMFVKKTQFWQILSLKLVVLSNFLDIYLPYYSYLSKKHCAALGNDRAVACHRSCGLGRTLSDQLFFQLSHFVMALLGSFNKIFVKTAIQNRQILFIFIKPLYFPIILHVISSTNFEVSFRSLKYSMQCLPFENPR